MPSLHKGKDKREERKKTLVSQNRFEVLSSRVMRCGVEIRKQKEERVAKVAMPQKEKQWKKPVHSIQRNVQEKEMKCFECEGEGH